MYLYIAINFSTGITMAHIRKFTRGGAFRMLLHYRRGKDKDGQLVAHGNSLIDESRSHLNYRLDGDIPSEKKLMDRLAQVRVMKRDDVKVLCSWIVTLPTDGSVAPDEEKQFFVAVKGFLDSKYGEKNCVSATVHMDESTPHMHYGFVPVVPDKKHGGEKVASRDLITKAHLRKFHTELRNYVEKELGHSVGLTIDDPEKVRAYTKNVDKLRTRTQEIRESIPDISASEVLSGTVSKKARDKLKERLTEELVQQVAQGKELQKELRDSERLTEHYRKELIKQQEELVEVKKENKEIKQELKLKDRFVKVFQMFREFDPHRAYVYLNTAVRELFCNPKNTQEMVERRTGHALMNAFFEEKNLRDTYIAENFPDKEERETFLEKVKTEGWQEAVEVHEYVKAIEGDNSKTSWNSLFEKLDPETQDFIAEKHESERIHFITIDSKENENDRQEPQSSLSVERPSPKRSMR